ncbi:MAG: phosphatidylserine decarboxylase [Verrucomicrobia bacterium]|nr:phosphatidylserine decarboxylase [Verrucomicrobiota bacterium]
MPAEPIRFFHRYKRQIETEQIFGEGWMRFAYENPAGRFLVWALARRACFSQWFGWRMNRKSSAQRVIPFITQYNLDIEEFAKSPFDFKTFNDFFYRSLKPEARPINGDDRVVVFPADGRHLVFPDVDTADGYYVKGAKFSVAELLGDDALAKRFAGGAMVISRLCPVDYHRFHFPLAGTPGETRVINGWLYSVSPVALRRQVRYLVENKRALTLVETDVAGTVAMIEVGATNVGSIRQSFVPGRPVKKGEEKGLFAFGGSCVITLLARGKVTFDADLVTQSSRQVETYARMGDRMGAVR